MLGFSEVWLNVRNDHENIRVLPFRTREGYGKFNGKIRESVTEGVVSTRGSEPGVFWGDVPISESGDP